MKCPRCITGRMFRDLEGESSCILCGWSGWPVATDSEEAQVLDALSRRPTRYEAEEAA